MDSSGRSQINLRGLAAIMFNDRQAADDFFDRPNSVLDVVNTSLSTAFSSINTLVNDSARGHKMVDDFLMNPNNFPRWNNPALF